jgi:glyoxylase-like metal-dependent hydrolase (beta-lactamase superfamily II)
VTQYLEDHDISISDILLTHWHGDHTGGVADLLAHDARTKVHKHKPSQNQQGIANGQVLRTQGATLRAVMTPGHTTDHTCFVLEEENALFTGDNVLGHGYSVAEDLGMYTASLRLMASLGCTTGYPGHGAVIKNLPRKIATYIKQRESRERQIYEALVKRASSGALRSGRNSSTSSSISDSSGGESDAGSSGDDEDDNDGLSITDICHLLYGELSKDTATFESALKPIINQVLLMLAERGKVDSKLVGLEETRHWFARIHPVN